MSMGAPEDEPKPPMQSAAPLQDPKAQRVTRAEFDRLQVEQVVHQHGAQLTEQQRAFALGLSTEHAAEVEQIAVDNYEAGDSAAWAISVAKARAQELSRSES